MKRVIGINGSPRTDGNTKRLIQTILSGAEAGGATTHMCDLHTLDFSGCTACMYCRTHHTCSLKDGMTTLLSEIFEADALVLGSPVYMWQVTGQTKLFMDRLYPVLNPDFQTRLHKKPRLVLAFTQGQPDDTFFEAYFEHTKSLLSFLGFSVTDIVVAVGTRDRTDIEKQTDLLARAYDVGTELAST